MVILKHLVSRGSKSHDSFFINKNYIFLSHCPFCNRNFVLPQDMHPLHSVPINILTMDVLIHNKNWSSNCIIMTYWQWKYNGVNISDKVQGKQF